MKNRAVRYCKHGNPMDVLVLEEIDMPVIGEGEVMIEMLATTIHPSDFGLISGTYGKLRELPAVVGREGVGRVLEIGRGVDTSIVGKLVAMPEPRGVWLDFSKTNAEDLIFLPSLVPLEQLAIAILNPMTAWRLLHDFEYLRKGDFIIQNAGNSAVGISVIQFAKKMGVTCISLVRNEDRINDLLEFGAEEVWLDDETIPSRIKKFTGGKMCSLALNSVGGRSALRLAKSLCSGGIHVTFGAMDGSLVRFPTRNLIFDDIKFVGFWLDRWKNKQSPAGLRSAIEDILHPLALSEIFHPIDKIYRLDCFLDALERNSKSRMGKVIIEREEGTISKS